MVARPQVGPISTVEPYLVLEGYSSIKHEYHGDYVNAMAGGSQARSVIAANVMTLLPCCERACAAAAAAL